MTQIRGREMNAENMETLYEEEAVSWEVELDLQYVDIL